MHGKWCFYLTFYRSNIWNNSSLIHRLPVLKCYVVSTVPTALCIWVIFISSSFWTSLIHSFILRSIWNSISSIPPGGLLHFWQALLACATQKTYPVSGFASRKKDMFICKLYMSFWLSFYIFLNVRKALFYRLYGHFSFVVNLTYLGLSSYIFAIKRG